MRNAAAAFLREIPQEEKPDNETVESLFSKTKGDDPDGDDLSVRLHPRLKCRAAFLSDFHLGTASSCARRINQFLHHIEPEYLYLVGDIVDCWHIGGLDLFKIHRQGIAHVNVLQRLIKMERRGVKLIYIPGNHDEWFRDRLEQSLPVHGLAILFEATHETKKGHRVLVIHGDSFDEIVRASRWLAVLGTRLYERLAVLSARIDRWRAYGGINRLLNFFGLREEWSLAHALRQASDRVVYSASYEKAALAYLLAKNEDILAWNDSHEGETLLPFYDELMCAHTHIPVRKKIAPLPNSLSPRLRNRSVIFSNTGSWVGDPSKGKKRENCPIPSCTAIIEDLAGDLRHIQWVQDIGIVPLDPDTNGAIKGLSLREAKERNERLFSPPKEPKGP